VQRESVDVESRRSREGRRWNGADKAGSGARDAEPLQVTGRTGVVEGDMHDNHGARPTERVRIPAVRIGPDGLGCMWHVSEIGGDTSSKFVGVSVVEYDGSAVHDVAGQAQLDGAGVRKFRHHCFRCG